MNSHIHVRTVKCTLYMYMTVRYVVPASCTAEMYFEVHD